MRLTIAAVLLVTVFVISGYIQDTEAYPSPEKSTSGKKETSKKVQSTKPVKPVKEVATKTTTAKKPTPIKAPPAPPPLKPTPVKAPPPLKPSPAKAPPAPPPLKPSPAKAPPVTTLQQTVAKRGEAGNSQLTTIKKNQLKNQDVITVSPVETKKKKKRRIRTTISPNAITTNSGKTNNVQDPKASNVKITKKPTRKIKLDANGNPIKKKKRDKSQVSSSPTSVIRKTTTAPGQSVGQLNKKNPTKNKKPKKAKATADSLKKLSVANANIKTEIDEKDNKKVAKVTFKISQFKKKNNSNKPAVSDIKAKKPTNSEEPEKPDKPTTGEKIKRFVRVVRKNIGTGVDYLGNQLSSLKKNYEKIPEVIKTGTEIVQNADNLLTALKNFNNPDTEGEDSDEYELDDEECDPKVEKSCVELECDKNDPDSCTLEVDLSDKSDDSGNDAGGADSTDQEDEKKDAAGADSTDQGDAKNDASGADLTGQGEKKDDEEEYDDEDDDDDDDDEDDEESAEGTTAPTL